MVSLVIPSDRALGLLARRVAHVALAHQLHLVTAESCTGGWIAKVLTDLSGSSAWFDAGVVTYSNAAKRRLLAVTSHSLAKCGAVSEEVALEMVSGALERFAADAAVAVTGIAGPSGGSREKPVGTVWIGWMLHGGAGHAHLYQFEGDREAVRRQTVAAALTGLQKILNMAELQVRPSRPCPM